MLLTSTKRSTATNDPQMRGSCESINTLDASHTTIRGHGEVLSVLLNSMAQYRSPENHRGSAELVQTFMENDAGFTMDNQLVRRSEEEQDWQHHLPCCQLSCRGGTLENGLSLYSRHRPEVVAATKLPVGFIWFQNSSKMYLQQRPQNHVRQHRYIFFKDEIFWCLFSADIRYYVGREAQEGRLSTPLAGHSSEEKRNRCKDSRSLPLSCEIIADLLVDASNGG